MDANNSNQQHGAPPRDQRDEASTLAWATLLFGVGSWVVLPVGGAIAAVICGLIEQRKIAEGTSSPAGNSMVTVGLVAGAIQLALAVLTIVAVVLFFALVMLGAMVA